MFEIKNGDSLDVLKTIPPESVQCIITSPPYYGLRDYGHEDAIGLEESLDEYMGRLIAVLGECKRILKPEGTLWLNLGDSYAGSGRGAGSTDGTIQGTSKGTHVLKKKKAPVVCEHGVAQAQGRRDHRIFEDGVDTGRKCYIAMSKPTRADYKLDKSPLQSNSRGSLKAPQTKGSTPVRRKSLIGVPWRIALRMIEDGWILRSDTIWAKNGPMPESVKDRPTRAHEYCFMFTKSEKYLYNWLDVAEPMKMGNGAPPVNGSIGAVGGLQSGRGQDSDARVRVNKKGEPRNEYAPHSKTLDAYSHYGERHGINPNGCDDDRDDEGVAARIPYRDGVPVRNRWSYQIVQSSSSYEGHYALFPVSSIIPLVLASTNEGDTVLDPFSGMATTGLAAIRHNRNYIGVEINPEYAETSRQRLIGDAPLLQHLNA